MNICLFNQVYVMLDSITQKLGDWHSSFIFTYSVSLQLILSFYSNLQS